MNVLFKLSTPMLESIRTDLRRPHHFAAERVGFLTCGAGALASAGIVILAGEYLSVPDEDYLDDPRYGALLGERAWRRILQHAFNRPVGCFHVHVHDVRGRVAFSSVDLREQAAFVPDFFNVQPGMPHGAIVIGQDDLVGRCWLPGEAAPRVINEFTIIGPGLRLSGRLR
jgi:hypothetical protein